MAYLHSQRYIHHLRRLSTIVSGRGSTRNVTHSGELMDLKLPAELWLDVLQRLPFADVQMLSTICKGMRLLTTPIVFRHAHLVINVPLERYREERGISYWEFKAKRNEAKRLFVERCEFFISDQIAPSVQSCKIKCDVSCIDDGLAISMIYVCFGLLPRFHGLRILSFMDVNLPFKRQPTIPSDFRSLASKPKESPSLRLQSIELHRTSWPTILQPDCIEYMGLYFEPQSIHCSLPAHPDMLKRLGEVRIEVDSRFFAGYIPFLYQCPALVSLTIIPAQQYGDPAQLEATIPPRNPPSLYSYRGADKFVHEFSQSGTLREVTLWGSYSRSTDLGHIHIWLADASALAGHLLRLAKFVPKLQKLRVCPWVLSDDVLHAVTSFSLLRQLEIDTYSRGSSERELKDLISAMIHVRLPSTLESLYIISLCYVDLRPHKQLLITLAMSYPNLKHVSVSGLCRTTYHHLRRLDVYRSPTIHDADVLTVRESTMGTGQHCAPERYTYGSGPGVDDLTYLNSSIHSLSVT